MLPHAAHGAGEPRGGAIAAYSARGLDARGAMAQGRRRSGLVARGVSALGGGTRGEQVRPLGVAAQRVSAPMEPVVPRGPIESQGGTCTGMVAVEIGVAVGRCRLGLERE